MLLLLLLLLLLPPPGFFIRAAHALAIPAILAKSQSAGGARPSPRAGEGGGGGLISDGEEARQCGGEALEREPTSGWTKGCRVAACADLIADREYARIEGHRRYKRTLQLTRVEWRSELVEHSRRFRRGGRVNRGSRRKRGFVNVVISRSLKRSCSVAYPLLFFHLADTRNASARSASNRDDVSRFGSGLSGGERRRDGKLGSRALCFSSKIRPRSSITLAYRS